VIYTRRNNKTQRLVSGVAVSLRFTAHNDCSPIHATGRGIVLCGMLGRATLSVFRNEGVWVLQKRCCLRE